MKESKSTAITLILLAFIFIISVAVILSTIMTARIPKEVILSSQKLENNFYRLIDGELVANDQLQNRPLAVMIENHIESRPAVGIDQASVIYEIIVEGDITRFLAIFDGDVMAKKIGPVRSARPFFVDLAEEWNPVYFHAGGSPAALKQLKSSAMPNINEISADGIYFWRGSNRSVPHNLFTSANLMQRAIVAKGFEAEADFEPWIFKSDSAQKESLATNIETNFSSNLLYSPTYEYNQDSNDYTRFINNEVDKTDKGIFLKTKNIVIQHVSHEIIDDYGRLDVNIGGFGEAEIYQDGIKINGTWERRDGRTRYYDFEGEEIKFNRGKIWISLVFN